MANYQLSFFITTNYSNVVTAKVIMKKLMDHIFIVAIWPLIIPCIPVAFIVCSVESANLTFIVGVDSGFIIDSYY